MLISLACFSPLCHSCCLPALSGLTRAYRWQLGLIDGKLADADCVEEARPRQHVAMLCMCAVTNFSVEDLFHAGQTHASETLPSKKPNLFTEWSPENMVFANQQITHGSIKSWSSSHSSHSRRLVFMQAVLWQVVDVTLKELRKQYFADLDSFWDARNIYQAQLQVLQVLHRHDCLHELLFSKSCCYACCNAHVCWPFVMTSALCYAKSLTVQVLYIADVLCQGWTISPIC